MPTPRVTMSKLRHTLQLLHGGTWSTRQIGAALGISKSTVSEIASYAREAGEDWMLAQTLRDEELQSRLYKPPVARESRQLEPDCAHIHRELRRPGVTLQLLRGTNINTQGRPTSTAPMAKSNSPTLGHPKFPQAGQSDYDDSGVMTMRAAASLSR